jgi:two-component system, NtrC family, sensor kinase
MRQSLDTTGTGLTLAALLLTLMVYLLLLLIVRRASRLVDQQSLQMQHSRAHLVQFDKMVMLGRMVAGVAHQLNTPLAYCRTNLRLLGELLARCTSDRPLREQDRSDARQMLDDTLGGVLMMDELVRHLRGFTRLDQAPTDHVDLNAAIASVVYIARSVVPPHIHIDERYDERLPHLNVHAARLNQAVLNLLMNAAQAIAGTGSVTVSTHRDAHAVRIAVADTGNGIPPSLHERVFEPFFTTKPSGQGTGLGLSVVREIVEQHGGRVDLSSQPGLGTTVTLHLPLPAGAHP